ncbi:S66 peptidase family protein [Streptomyces lancefieldiae]|uniref:LD-carboxypeptidase n=1 Tax=Streptomyces lancefieldiae TaxID=3075520 RepID=A0ABU3B2P1_9ACTN|nr:LD-carboxypeptidase [Streptomyces sp. DSM 40712]MDT0616499.1 LD-carboxypeptidase [Streptomyces sp. DSM 40712]
MSARLLPAPLSKGGRVGVVTVSAPEPAAHPDVFDRGLDRLRSRGYEPVIAPHAASRDGYRAGSETQLVDDFHAFLTDPGIDAVVCAGGGKSANRLLRGLDYELIAQHPKPIVGVSDPSLLLNAITARTGLITFHGPAVLWDFGAEEPPTATGDHFAAVLAGDAAAARIDAPLTWARTGTARGHLVAGCLSSLRCLLGTVWEPDWNGAVLAWEDAFKPVEQLDQALTHFRDRGVLDQIAGMVVGELVSCEPSGGVSAHEMVMDLCAEYDFPIAFGLPFGHTPLKHTLPVGAEALVDSGAACGLTITSPWTAQGGDER